MRMIKMSLLISVCTVIFYIWLYLFWELDWLRLLGTNALSLFGSAISFVILFRTYLVLEKSQRYFWLLLSISALFYFAGYSVCFYYQTILSIELPYPNWADYMWLTSYTFVLAAFIYAIFLRTMSASIKPLLFNVVLFLIIIITVSLRYIVQPVFTISGYSVTGTAVAIAYPLFDFVYLVVLFICYYLSISKHEQVLVKIFSVGVLMQLIADFIYVYWALEHSMTMGTFLDPVWQLNLFLKGVAGLYAQKHLKNRDTGSPFYKEGSLSLLPYIGAVILLGLTIYEYYQYLNILVAGCVIVLLLIIWRQISIMKKHEKLMGEYKHLAYHDALTGLGNRMLLRKEIEVTYRHPYAIQRQSALLLIDLDRFKGVNDTLGHQAGDELLRELSERFKGAVKNSGTVYRIGGDEFLVFLSEVNAVSDVFTVAERILASLQRPAFIRENEIVTTPSIGISLYPEHGYDFETLFRNADAAMYLAKEKGKNTYELYNSALNDILLERMRMETGLRKAIEKSEFTLYYQPKMDMRSHKLIGMEALLRWNHPKWGMVPPAKFIAIAEETGQIVPIGEWVIREACKQTKKWQMQGLNPGVVSVNVSVRQFKQNHFTHTVSEILRDTGLNAHFLELEITESVIQDLDRTKEILHDLRKMGVRTSIDDFGTGYSSLSVIKKLPVDVVKLDKSFIDDLADPANLAIVKAVLAMGESLDHQVIAEGIEEQQQVETLLGYNCYFGQGYLFGKPIPAEEFQRFLSDSQVSC